VARLLPGLAPQSRIEKSQCDRDSIMPSADAKPLNTTTVSSESSVVTVSSQNAKLLMGLPTREEINLRDTPAEQVACDHFLGKNLDEAEAMFREDPFLYQEDLLWMGPSAFRFYVEAAIQYIRSRASDGDSDTIACFASILDLRLKRDPSAVIPLAETFRSVCAYVIEHWNKFDAESLQADVRPRYIVLQETFKRLSGRANG
jgi:hypothetical protein